TNKCNAACFYCPTSQQNDEVPSTQGLDFETPMAYANYVNALGFKGVAFSGGEPFLYFERTLAYLKAVREVCAPDLYIWCYTNGILADTDKLQALADAGLNELRFDIGATGFSLEYVKRAQGIIPKITIEIPSVPEELDRLKALLPEIIAAGVSGLNLHQLRLTTHTVRHLAPRGYTIINAEKPIVLESELAALELIDYANEQGYQIGINYCSFFFKNRFQKAGFRTMLIHKLSPHSSVSENGYIREYDGKQLDYSYFKISDVAIDKELSKQINDLGLTVYTTPISIFSEEIPAYLCSEVEGLLAQEPKEVPTDELLFRIWQLEYMEAGLRVY
ncbi:MAG: radical SAM protein, partial [Bacteroidales bacterium]|nr:radical SAM protein [Bacteroidales bacterium]